MHIFWNEISWICANFVFLHLCGSLLSREATPEAFSKLETKNQAREYI